jgi:hypothetical protein
MQPNSSGKPLHARTHAPPRPQVRKKKTRAAAGERPGGGVSGGGGGSLDDKASLASGAYTYRTASTFKTKASQPDFLRIPAEYEKVRGRATDRVAR